MTSMTYDITTLVIQYCTNRKFASPNEVKKKLLAVAPKNVHNPELLMEYFITYKYPTRQLVEFQWDKVLDRHSLRRLDNFSRYFIKDILKMFR